MAVAIALVIAAVALIVITLFLSAYVYSNTPQRVLQPEAIYYCPWLT